MSDTWRARYADGRTAAVHDVVLEVVLEDPGGTQTLLGRRAEDGAALLRWSVATITCEELGAGRLAISSASAPDASLTTDAGIGPALGLPPPRALRSPRVRVALGFGLGTIAVAAALYLSMTPLARAIAFHVPPAVEASLGQGFATILATQYCETEEARAALQALATRLGAPPGTELHILDSDTVNAFTFPGGVVILTRGILERAESSDEIAGVLGHELEHVDRRHVMIRFVRTSLLTALWQASVGDYSGLFVIDPKTALDIANLRFSRADEREADAGALARLDRAGISRAGFRDFFDRMRAKTDLVPAWLSSHPASAERIATVRAPGPAPLERDHARPALSPADWQALKDGCASGHAAASAKTKAAPKAEAKAEAKTKN